MTTLVETKPAEAMLEAPALLAAPPTRCWTTTEEKILRANYAAFGGVGCVALLPRHSIHAIQQRAYRLGVPFTGTRRGKQRKRWTTTEHFDALIRRTYQGTPKRGQGAALAKTLQRPQWWVKNRAAELGISLARVKEPNWCAREIEIVTQSASCAARTIVGKLKREGFIRTTNAVVLKLSRRGVDRGDYDGYTAGGLAVLMGVNSNVVLGWITKGWLKANHRRTDNDNQGHAYSIQCSQIRRFVIENPAAVDIRKVDKLWFIDLLAASPRPPRASHTQGET